jgi:hypothetical protein
VVQKETYEGWALDSVKVGGKAVHEICLVVSTCAPERKAQGTPCILLEGKEV